MTNEVQVTIDEGLGNTVAAATRISSIDGLAGELIIGGFPLEDIAGHATFEEIVFLLWHDRLPNAQELDELHEKLIAQRSLPKATYVVLRAAAQEKSTPIDALLMATGTLSLGLESDASMEMMAIRAVAALPTIIAAYWRLLNGQEPIEPRMDLSHAANYLYMLTGEEPTAAQVRALDTYINTVCDHGFNASAFTARVIISTHSDVISAVVGAIGALKGPRHGGAPGPALDMVFEIGKPENAEPYLRAKLDRGELLMGFGHRVYKVRDPRAEVLRIAAESFFTDGEQADLYNLVCYVEDVAVRLLAEYKPGRNLQTNVEFYTALILHGIGLPTALFTPTFAVGRVAGWVAHCFEHYPHGRIIRPRAAYVGERDRKWVPLEER